MQWIEIFGYIGAFFIGLIMGILGGGGSILAVPILAYIFHLDEKIATAYSLFVVGSTGLIGGLRQTLNKMVDWKAAITFGIPAVIGITTVRAFVVPNLPEILFEIGSFEFTRRMGMFGLFAVLMLLAATSMLSNKTKNKSTKEIGFNPLILSEGLFIGGLTGLVGAGGGFLIVPALIVIAQLDMKKASATSLIIIALNSLTGFFLGDATHMEINWKFLSIFVGIAMSGIIIGTFLNQLLPVKLLKKSFAYFIIAMAIFIFVEEFIIG